MLALIQKENAFHNLKTVDIKCASKNNFNVPN